MRIAWFSPLPPVRSGIATYSAEIVPRLGREHVVDCFVDRGSASRGTPQALPGERVFDAHDFVWKHQRAPYDLVVYQLGNAACHDYIWAYLAAYPGLVVLHDARLHQARARRLLRSARFDDYRAEFWYDQPDATRDFVEYAVAGLGGPIYYFWPMLRVVMRTARTIAVHNARVAAELGEAYPDVAIETIRMGVPPIAEATGARARVRRALGVPDEAIVFAAFGKVTAEKRIAPILGALGALAAEGRAAHLLLIGDPGDAHEAAALARELARHGVADRVHAAGYVADEAIGDCLAAADACLCLRWPTALETSASWLRCLAAGRATVITELAHLADVPTIDPHSWTASHARAEPVAIGIDLLDEDRSLLLAMRRLADEARFREELGRRGRAYWAAEHTLDLMAADYRRAIEAAAARPAPAVADLPAHFTDDHGERARRIVREFGVESTDFMRP